MSSSGNADALIAATEAWWRTSIIQTAPDAIHVRGYSIASLLGRVSLAEMLWLMLREELPRKEAAELLEAAMVAAAVHGPHAPSIAIARMAITCGVGINQAIAQGAGVLGDVHGGAIQQLMELLKSMEGADEAEMAQRLDRWIAQNGRFVPGFGHRFHQDGDPRTARLLELAGSAKAAGLIAGHHLENVESIGRILSARKGKTLPMNVDGIAGAIFLELGFDPVLGRGLIVLARSFGVLAHAWEELCNGRRLKGPVPPTVGYSFEGRAPRDMPG